MNYNAVKNLGIRLFGKQERPVGLSLLDTPIWYYALILDEDDVPTMIKHDGYGNHLGEAVWDGQQWRIKTDE